MMQLFETLTVTRIDYQRPPLRTLVTLKGEVTTDERHLGGAVQFQRVPAAFDGPADIGHGVALGSNVVLVHDRSTPGAPRYIVEAMTGTTTVLRVYDPSACDPSTGVPLDWEKCRTCDGTGSSRAREFGRIQTPDGPVFLMPPDGPAALNEPCPTCAGHGSLKEAALRHFERLEGERDGPRLPSLQIRCEHCRHPMSAGTWEDRGHHRHDLVAGLALQLLRDGREPASLWEPISYPHAVHWSACDEHCTHSGHGRWADFEGEIGDAFAPFANAGDAAGSGWEASWRQVDVRTLGWPHDLRPEKLAVLCMRCWAKRSAT